MNPYHVLLFVCFPVCGAVDDITFCVVTAKREVSYLAEVVRGLDRQSASYIVVDVDNSTTRGYVKPPRDTRECMVGYVSCPVQQQALDVMNALKVCKERHAKGWICLIEDDMVPCDGSIQQIHQTIHIMKANYKTARFAKFSRAVAFPVQKIEPYVAYVENHLSNLPYDHAISHDWSTGADYIHKESLFAHAGDVSTIIERNDAGFISKYSNMRSELCGGQI